MSEKNTAPINVSLTQIPDSIDKTAEGLLVKPAQTIGSTISDLFHLVFGFISFNAEKQRIRYSLKLDAYKKKVENEINAIPSDKIIEPNLQVAGQALENSKFCIESDELTTMFSKLIASSMNSDTISNVHPSFPEILKQMAPQDAHLLLEFKKNSMLPICKYRIAISDSGYHYPLSEIYLNNSLINLEPTYYSSSLASLKRLGLIDIDFLNFLTDDDKYSVYISHTYYSRLQYNYGTKNVSIEKGIAGLTPLGESFIKVCVPDKFD